MRFKEVIVSVYFMQSVSGYMARDETVLVGRGQITKGPVSWVRSLHFILSQKQRWDV